MDSVFPGCYFRAKNLESMKHEDVTERIIGICIKVHEILGPGLLESIYEDAICLELKRAGIGYKRQVEISVKYEGEVLGVGFRADIIVEDVLILELKSVEKVTKIHAKTLMSYMRLTGIEIGLLINFNVNLLKDGITRLVDDEWQKRNGNK